MQKGNNSIKNGSIKRYQDMQYSPYCAYKLFLKYEVEKEDTCLQKLYSQTVVAIGNCPYGKKHDPLGQVS